MNSLILASILMSTVAMGDEGRTQTAPVYTIVIDLKHIDAADIAVLFGGRFLVGRTSLRYQSYSRSYGGYARSYGRYGSGNYAVGFHGRYRRDRPAPYRRCR